MSMLLIPGLILLTWLITRKLNSYKNEPMASLDLGLEDKDGKEWSSWLTKRVALRHALDKGIDPKQYTIEQLVEQYREHVKEVGIEAAIKEFGITREEAIAQGFDKGGSIHVYLKSRQIKEGKKLGREISWKEFLEIEKNAIVNSKFPGPDCWEPWESRAYLEGKNFPSERVAHLDSCAACHSLVAAMAPDPEMQKPLGA